MYKLISAIIIDYLVWYTFKSQTFNIHYVEGLNIHLKLDQDLCFITCVFAIAVNPTGHFMKHITDMWLF